METTTPTPSSSSTSTASLKVEDGKEATSTADQTEEMVNHSSSSRECMSSTIINNSSSTSKMLSVKEARAELSLLLTGKNPKEARQDVDTKAESLQGEEEQEGDNPDDASESSSDSEDEEDSDEDEEEEEIQPVPPPAEAPVEALPVPPARVYFPAVPNMLQNLFAEFQRQDLRYYPQHRPRHQRLHHHQQQRPPKEEEPEKTPEELQAEQERVMELLQMHPCLCNEVFDHLYPLEYLICEYQAPLPIVKQVYNLGDAAILKYRSQRKKKRSVLHSVCYFGANHDQGNIISFLAQECPKNVSRPDAKGYAPLQLLLRDIDHQEPLESIQALLDIFPASIMTRKVPDPRQTDHEHSKTRVSLHAFSLLRFSGPPTRKDPLTPIQYALRAQYPASTLEYLFSQVHNNNNHLTNQSSSYTLASDWHGGQRASDQDRFLLDENAAKGLAVLLPQLSSFTCQAQRWTVRGFYQLLQVIGSNTSVKHLNLVMPIDLIHYQILLQHMEQANDQDNSNEDTTTNSKTTIDSTAHQFRDCFHQNNTITHLTLEGYGSLWPVQYALGSLVYLHLRKFQLDAQQSHALSDILRDKRAPREIILQHIQLEGPYKPCNFATRKNYECPITGLDITLDVSNSDWIYGLLQDLRKAQHFMKLTLTRGRAASSNLTSMHSSPHWNITKRICAILKRNRLCHLTVCSGFYLEFAPIAEELATNTSLQTYIVETHARSTACRVCMADLLQTHNATLEYVSTADSTVHGQMIWYYTKLNKYGRYAIRNTNGMTLQKFVRQLVCIQQDSDVKQGPYLSSSSRPNHNETKLHYGLLRENPSLWCHGWAGATSA